MKRVKLRLQNSKKSNTNHNLAQNEISLCIHQIIFRDIHGSEQNFTFPAHILHYVFKRPAITVSYTNFEIFKLI